MDQGLYTNDLGGLNIGLQQGLDNGIHLGLQSEKNVGLSLTEKVLAYWKLNPSNADFNTSLYANDEKAIRNQKGNSGHYIFATVGPGIIQNSYSFTRSLGHYININPSTIGVVDDSLKLGGTDYSISFWLYPFSVNIQQNILMKGSYASLKTYMLVFINSSGKIGNILSYNLDANYDNIISNTSIVANKYQHVVFVKRTTERTASIYINNVKDTASIIKTVTAPTLNYVDNGCIATDSISVTSNNFNGRLSEMGVWSKALSEQEISYLYNKGKGITYPFIKTTR